MKWQIDPAHTNVTVAVKHMAISTVRGRFTSGAEGTIEYDRRRRRSRASSSGSRPKTAVQIDGKDLYLGVNAYVYAELKATK